MIWFHIHIYKVPGIVKFIETEERTVATRGWGRGPREFLLNGFGVQFGMMMYFWR